MIDPTQENRILKDVNGIKNLAYSTIFEKYMIQKFKGDKKLLEIDSTDQESVVQSLNGGYPIPGMTYTFLYKGPNVIMELKKGGLKEYTDLVPVIFCMNIDRGNFSGINFNMLPTDARLDFLQSFYDTFSDFLEKKVDILTQSGKLALNQKFIELMKSGGGQTMIKLFNQKNKANFNFGYRKYLIEKVSNFRMIEYSEWKFIPFYEPKDAFRKITYSQLYQMYDRG
jgi:hypothetical protein